ncbi:S-adenosylmethionine decarboxylase proenzyme [Trichomonascus vanleenenianus]|uniref:adenosylmethionine decarboxylase SPE2 n=1 Tax=Trichomonascus vanleenenianus TaxID=2268995 RepID=UPI003ECB97E2
MVTSDLYTKYVNLETSVNLDSTDAFEGPEKLLEIWYAPTAAQLPHAMGPRGLREVPRAAWEDILDHVHCKVLSVVETEEMDAFVLSESSMFVFPHKVILKTCGTTTTLAGIQPMQHAIAQYAGYPRDKQPWRVFYSRKSFMFPEKQQHPHRSWADEVACLDGLFENGTAYVVGNIAKDHWYLYATVPLYFDTNLRMPVNGVPVDHPVRLNDQTLEILMTDLSPLHAAQFYTDRLPGAATLDCADAARGGQSPLGAAADDEDPGHELGNIVTKIAGIDQIYPTTHQVIDSFMFTPCGYSCNGLVTEGHYFTIHVTPEQECSYASFETTVPPAEYNMTNMDVLEKVLEIFRPGKFSVTLFDSEVESISSSVKLPTRLSSYKRTEMIRYDMNGYDLVYMAFESLKYKC